MPGEGASIGTQSCSGLRFCFVACQRDGPARQGGLSRLVRRSGFRAHSRTTPPPPRGSRRTALAAIRRRPALGARWGSDGEARFEALHAHRYALHLGVFAYCFGAVLPAHPAQLVAAEGDLGLIAIGIEEDVAAFERMRDAMALADVVTPYIGSQAEIRIVGHVDGLAQFVIGNDAEDGSEQLFAGDRHPVRHLGQDGRREEVTLNETGCTRLFAAAIDVGAFFDAVLAVARSPFPVR